MKQLKTKINVTTAKMQMAKFCARKKFSDFLCEKDAGEKNTVYEMLMMAVVVIFIAAIVGFMTPTWTTLKTKMQTVIDTVF